MAAKALTGCLLLGGLALLATPAQAGRLLPQCKPVYATIETSWIAQSTIEVGWVSGSFDTGMYLLYDDTAPPIDPAASKPNMVFSDKTGELLLWVVGESILDKDGWYRTLKVLRYEGTGAYAGYKLDLWAHGYFTSDKGGAYELEGTMCPSAIKPRTR